MGTDMQKDGLYMIKIHPFRFKDAQQIRNFLTAFEAEKTVEIERI